MSSSASRVVRALAWPILIREFAAEIETFIVSIVSFLLTSWVMALISKRSQINKNGLLKNTVKVLVHFAN